MDGVSNIWEVTSVIFEYFLFTLPMYTIINKDKSLVKKKKQQN